MSKQCPICKQVFAHGWAGIDAHWRSKHESVMPYEDARLKYGFNRYPPKSVGTTWEGRAKKAEKELSLMRNSSYKEIAGLRRRIAELERVHALLGTESVVTSRKRIDELERENEGYREVISRPYLIEEMVSLEAQVTAAMMVIARHGLTDQFADAMANIRGNIHTTRGEDK